MSRDPKAPIRVLVVDDSSLMRRLLSDGLAADPMFDVVATAADAYEARDLIVSKRPQVMTLDVEMPRMNGVDFLRRLMPQYPLPVVMVSGLTTAGGDLALASLAAGAVDVVLKAQADRPGDMARMLDELRTKVRIAATANVSAWKRAMIPAHNGGAGNKMVAPPSPSVIAIGASTGGTDATRRVLAHLPLDVPGVVVVQHMPAGFTSMYADRLNQELRLRVVEAHDGEPILGGTVYVAPGELQCAVVRAGDHFAIRVRPGPKVSGHAPSVDVLFASVAASVGRAAVGVLLTGMGRDGADGLLEMRRAGARTLSQDEATSVVYGMPREAWQQGASERQVGIDDMAAEIVARLPRRQRATSERVA
ncbi:MAG: chemotaxis response regulator protein-glutamate methylesterase [Deltaproteobacteria bacterium]|nr:chemotaxis response regulator protein-glutamate methylesterase [Deltaproteobacteria bacterium]